MCPAPNTYVEALTLNLVVFGGGPLEVVKVRLGNVGEVPMMGLVSLQKNDHTGAHSIV